MASRNWERVWLGFLFQLAAVAGRMADERIAVGAVEVIKVLDVAGRPIARQVPEFHRASAAAVAAASHRAPILVFLFGRAFWRPDHGQAQLAPVSPPCNSHVTSWLWTAAEE